MSIFVGIPSFRDSEAQHTIANLFDTAKDPNNVFIGVFHQLAEEDKDTCFRIPYKYPENVREEIIDCKEATGPCFARYRVQQLYKGEDFYLSIDSHMRMVEHWDERLKQCWKKCNSEKAILTTYPVGYEVRNWKKEETEKDFTMVSCFSFLVVFLETLGKTLFSTKKKDHLFWCFQALAKQMV